MNYKAMPGSVIIKINEKADVETRDSGIMLVTKEKYGATEVAEVLSVGDERDDLKVGMKILFPPTTGLNISKGIYYLKYEDICAIVSD